MLIGPMGVYMLAVYRHGLVDYITAKVQPHVISGIRQLETDLSSTAHFLLKQSWDAEMQLVANIAHSSRTLLGKLSTHAWLLGIGSREPRRYDQQKTYKDITHSNGFS